MRVTSFLLNYLNGTNKKISNLPLTFVDVRDVATSHLLAYEKNVGGRILTVGNNTSWVRAVEILKLISPNSPIPSEVDGKVVERTVDNNKSLELGVTYRSLEDSILDTVQSLIQFGYYSIPI